MCAMTHSTWMNAPQRTVCFLSTVQVCMSCSIRDYPAGDYSGRSLPEFHPATFSTVREHEAGWLGRLSGSLDTIMHTPVVANNSIGEPDPQRGYYEVWSWLHRSGVAIPWRRLVVCVCHNLKKIDLSREEDICAPFSAVSVISEPSFLEHISSSSPSPRFTFGACSRTCKSELCACCQSDFTKDSHSRELTRHETTSTRTVEFIRW